MSTLSKTEYATCFSTHIRTQTFEYTFFRFTDIAPRAKKITGECGRFIFFLFMCKPNAVYTARQRRTLFIGVKMFYGKIKFFFRFA